MLTSQLIDLFVKTMDDAEEQIPVQLERDGPITAMFKSQLFKRVEFNECGNEVSCAIEYRLVKDAQPVHRSVMIHLKKPMVFAEGSIADLPQP